MDSHFYFKNMFKLKKNLIEINAEYEDTDDNLHFYILYIDKKDLKAFSAALTDVVDKIQNVVYDDYFTSDKSIVINSSQDIIKFLD